MNYLQCTGSLTRADRAETLWLNARAVAECRYDITGSLGHEHARPQ